MKPHVPAALISTMTLDTTRTPLSIADFGAFGVIASYPAEPGKAVQRRAQTAHDISGGVRVVVTDRNFGSSEWTVVAEYVTTGDLSAAAWLAVTEDAVDVVLADSAAA